MTPSSAERDDQEPKRSKQTLDRIAVGVAVFAAIIATWQAFEASRSAAEQRAAARSATADQVIVLGDEQGHVANGIGESSNWGLFADVPTKVQNYGRLPVSEVVIEIRLTLTNGATERYIAPVGPLAPCKEIEVVEPDLETHKAMLNDAERVELYVHFTDPAGYEWVRGTSGNVQMDEGWPLGADEIAGKLSRSEITDLRPCAGLNSMRAPQAPRAPGH